MKKLFGLMWNILEKTVYVILNFLFRLFGRTLEDNQFEAFIQFIKFGIVGLSNTVISYVIYVVSLLGLQKLGLFPRIDYLCAQILAFVLSVLWSFYWNNKMVFVQEEGRERNVFYALIKTYISYSFTGLFLNSVLLVLWVKVLGISEFIAPIINLVVSVPINFLINKFWAFK